mmetsp:Transcript_130/g.237  ORF Transcript_130/g.237 Transcript_130/m.237 type:complete len:439 (-) Transcript_130:533-1849(-)
MTGGHKGTEKCDASAAAVFIVGLAAGTGCTIASKALFQVETIGSNGELQTFKPPLFQTWVMFLGMSFALPAHYISEWWRRKNATAAELVQINAEPKVTAKTYMLLAIPSVFDLIATFLMVIGLLHTPASIWMLLRGGGIVFVAMMKHFVLKDTLKPSMWVGVGIIALAVLCVGAASSMGASDEEDTAASGSSDAIAGVLITLAGTFVQSVQYTYEESVMSGETSAPPWLLIGMEGITGTVISTFILYPIMYIIPGSDNGSYEDAFNTITMIKNSSTILALSITFCVLVFILNSFSVLVTYMMSSVWHAILDNFRPITIWVVELALYYVFTDGAYGEAWTSGSYLQLAGMCLLLYGTAVYNGSVTFPGMTTDALLGKASTMSTPSLARSPLMTQNRAPPPFGGENRSPYLGSRPTLTQAQGDNPMVLNVGVKTAPLLPK